MSVIIGGAEGDRTPDLRIANATLSQLSYGPIAWFELFGGRGGICWSPPPTVKHAPASPARSARNAALACLRTLTANATVAASRAVTDHF